MYKGDARKCIDCNLEYTNDIETSKISNSVIPKIKNNKKNVFSEESAYQMTSFLMGVIERGTAKNINDFDFQVAGKTGTTNDNQDAWFIGFNSEITVGVFVGYDVPKSLGRFETGSKVASYFYDLMKKLYKSYNPKPFVIPEEIKFINIDLVSGKPSNSNYITEAFKTNFNFDFEVKDDNNEESLDLRGFLLMSYDNSDLLNKLQGLLKNLRGSFEKKNLNVELDSINVTSKRGENWKS